MLAPRQDAKTSKATRLRRFGVWFVKAVGALDDDWCDSSLLPSIVDRLWLVCWNMQVCARVVLVRYRAEDVELRPRFRDTVWPRRPPAGI